MANSPEKLKRAKLSFNFYVYRAWQIKRGEDKFSTDYFICTCTWVHDSYLAHTKLKLGELKWNRNRAGLSLSLFQWNSENRYMYTVLNMCPLAGWPIQALIAEEYYSNLFQSFHIFLPNLNVHSYNTGAFWNNIKCTISKFFNLNFTLQYRRSVSNDLLAACENLYWVQRVHRGYFFYLCRSSLQRQPLQLWVEKLFSYKSVIRFQVGHKFGIFIPRNNVFACYNGL